MLIESVYDPSFRKYGKVIEGLDTSSLLEKAGRIPFCGDGVAYEPSIEALEADGIKRTLEESVYGEMPIQIGLCWGHNTMLNCLEYHRDSEINIGTGDFILLLATADDVEDGKIDTAKVKAFRAPGAVAVEVYATSFHYAPCQVSEEGFRVVIVLPSGTNYPLEKKHSLIAEDKLLRARNKWLYAHPDTAEAADGAYIGLVGENIDISK